MPASRSKFLWLWLHLHALMYVNLSALSVVAFNLRILTSFFFANWSLSMNAVNKRLRFESFLSDLNTEYAGVPMRELAPYKYTTCPTFPVIKYVKNVLIFEVESTAWNAAAIFDSYSCGSKTLWPHTCEPLCRQAFGIGSCVDWEESALEMPDNDSNENTQPTSVDCRTWKPSSISISLKSKALVPGLRVHRLSSLQPVARVVCQCSGWQLPY